MKDVSVHVKLPVEAHKTIKIEALKKNIPLKQLILQILIEGAEKIQIKSK